MIAIDQQSLNKTLLFFFFNDTATTEIYTLSLHDALPISLSRHPIYTGLLLALIGTAITRGTSADAADRKSTRLNSSHLVISYAVFCLKKKNKCDVPILQTLYALSLHRSHARRSSIESSAR